MLEGVGIGDLHFDKLERTLPGIGNKAIVKELRKPLNYALKNGIEHAFYYGDIGEYARFSYEALILFMDVLLDPKYEGLYQWIYLGNHDFDEEGRNSLEVLVSLLSLLKRRGIKNRIRVFTQPEDLEIDDVPVRILPYPHTNTSGKRLNFGHFEVSGAIRDNGRRIKEGVETEHLCLIGHLHTCHKVANSYFSGTLYQTNFGEKLPKSFHHFKVKGDLKHKIINVPNDPEYKLFNLEIYSRKDLEKISDSEKDLYKLFVQDGVKINPDDLTKYKNVIKLNKFKDEKDLKVQLEEEWKIENVGTVFQPQEDLKELLVTKNVREDLKQRTLKLHKKMLRKTGFIEEAE
jgi:hypothetical protein